MYVIAQKKADDGQPQLDDKGQPILVAERRFVDTGERRDGQVVIGKGLHSGEQVVTAGQLKLNQGAVVAISPDKTIQAKQDSQPR
ncbi:hypothetical protein D3C86_1900410 [compost metagenome]